MFFGDLLLRSLVRDKIRVSPRRGILLGTTLSVMLVSFTSAASTDFRKFLKGYFQFPAQEILPYG
jgi:hypothetical protein